MEFTVNINGGSILIALSILATGFGIFVVIWKLSARLAKREEQIEEILRELKSLRIDSQDHGHRISTMEGRNE